MLNAVPSVVVQAALAGILWASPDIAGGPSERDPQDGRVDAADLVALLARFGPCDDACCRGDINRDGYIDVDDLTIMLSVIDIYDPSTFVRCRASHEPGSPPG